MSYIGTTEIGKMFLGDVEIDKAYLGDDLVFSGTHVPQQHTLTKNPSSYVEEESSFLSISNAGRAYTSHTSTTYATINMNTGARALTYIHYVFDVSSIPANATIDSVSCVVKTNLSSGTTNIPSAAVNLYSGSTAKLTAVSVTGTTAKTTTLSDDNVSWTRGELAELRLRFAGQRSSSNVTSALSMRFYGATLTVTYTV